MDDQTPAETVDATAQMQIDDQTPAETVDATAQAQMDDQAPNNLAKAASQAQLADQRYKDLGKSLDEARAAAPIPKMEFYERFYDGHVEFAAGDPQQVAVAKRVKDIAMKHHETMVQWPRSENSDHF